MTAPTDEFTRIARESRRTFTAAARHWGEALQNAAGSVTLEHPVPTREHTLALVDSWFDMAAQLLADQRTATTALVTRGHEAVTTLSEQAGAATSTLTEKVAATAGAAAETLTKARAPRNGASRTA
ncbi:hypothetical protein [Pseudonocardia broussonetiae]|uniref:Phasin domain-containing protein n=1 Tax=Pseudonocardia broussonetiae TaxID=2736640 RepID=A0A6M6JNK9_9PSEU|nr:hypothetical protein [Pseudonocardia broussonetiae]QJY48945.1 hypothetical protein HOP40_26805 [Pseudonocardia broussonetiae]